MPEWIFQAAGVVGVTVGAYAAVRADLAALRVKVEMAVQRADTAHGRIDILIDRRGK